MKGRGNTSTTTGQVMAGRLFLLRWDRLFAFIAGALWCCRERQCELLHEFGPAARSTLRYRAISFEYAQVPQRHLSIGSMRKLQMTVPPAESSNIFYPVFISRMRKGMPPLEPSAASKNKSDPLTPMKDHHSFAKNRSVGPCDRRHTGTCPLRIWAIMAHRVPFSPGSSNCLAIKSG